MFLPELLHLIWQNMKMDDREEYHMYIYRRSLSNNYVSQIGNISESQKCNSTKILNSQLFSAVVAVILTFIFTIYLSTDEDFTMTIDSISQTSNIKNFNHERIIKINSEVWYKPYNHPIILNATLFNNEPIPRGISLEFDPEGNMKGTFTSRMKIRGSPNIADGCYVIKINAFGGDGRIRNCYYILKIDSSNY